MARFEGKFPVEGSEPLELEQLLDLLRANAPDVAASLENARACYLSSSDGWRDAGKKIGGAFADVGGADLWSKE
ncbi:MAG: hypothetical protein ABIO29_06235 [Sphingomicrobium sp.]